MDRRLEDSDADRRRFDHHDNDGEEHDRDYGLSALP